MSMLFRNWLDEGFYEEDGYGCLTKIEDPHLILQAQQNGNLYENDGLATTKVHTEQEINLKND